MRQEVIKMAYIGQAKTGLDLDELEQMAGDGDDVLIPSATLLELVRRARAQDAEAAKPKCPAEEIIAIYHQAMPDNPKVKVLNEARRRLIRCRWTEAAKLTCKPFGYSNRQDGLKAWRAFFEVCAESDFLTGKTPSWNGRPPFIADIDFIMSPSGFAKILENKYHRELA